MDASPDGMAPASFVGSTAAAASAISIVVFPGFLLGAFGPSIKEDLGFGDGAFGALFTMGFFIGALVLQVAGHFADSDPRRAIRVGLVVAMAASSFVSLFADGYLWLALGFGVSRVAEGIVQPATNAFITGTVTASRRGLALGMKQSAVPLTTSAAGLAVPVLGQLIGWRGVFAVIVVCAAPVVWRIPPAKPSIPRANGSRTDIWKVPHLRIAALAGGCAAAAVVIVPSFLTTVAVDDAGFTDGQAGLLLTMGGIVLTASRVALGASADRRVFDRFRVIAALLTVSTAAFPLLATGTKPGLLAGSLLLFGVGWTFPGLLLVGIIEQHPEAPGAATAVVQTGIAIGAMISPLLFGLVADSTSYAVAWMLPLTFMIVGALLMAVTSFSIRRRTVGPATVV